MLTVVIVALCTIGYLQVGWSVAFQSLKTWKERKLSWRSFLLFPSSHQKQMVGIWDMSPISGLFLVGGNDNTTLHHLDYLFWTTICWPMKFLVNLPAYCLYTFLQGISASKRAFVNHRT